MGQFESNSSYNISDLASPSTNISINNTSYLSNSIKMNNSTVEEVSLNVDDSTQLAEDEEWEEYEVYEEDYVEDESGNKMYIAGTGKKVKKKRKKKKQATAKAEPLVKKELTSFQLEKLKYIREKSKIELEDEYIYDITYDEGIEKYTITTPFGKIEMNESSSTIEPFVYYYFKGIDDNERDRLDINFLSIDKISVNKNGICISMPNGSLIIDDSNKYKFIDEKGKSHLFTTDAIRILKNNKSFHFPDGITFDSNGNMTYENEVLSFNSEGDLISYHNTKEKINVTFDYNIEEHEKQGLYDIYNDASEHHLNAPTIEKVNFVATVYVKWHKYPFYSIGEQTGIENSGSKAYTIEAAKNFNRYSDKYLSTIDEYYFGTVIGGWDMSITDYSNTSTAAYTNLGVYNEDEKNIFVFIPTNNLYRTFYKATNNATELDLIFYHENAHLLEECLRRKGNINENQVDGFYNKYKDLVPQLSASVYDPIPNNDEFFAELVSNYYNAPEEVQRYMPDAYEYLKQLCE